MITWLHPLRSLEIKSKCSSETHSIRLNAALVNPSGQELIDTTFQTNVFHPRFMMILLLLVGHWAGGWRTLLSLLRYAVGNFSGMLDDITHVLFRCLKKIIQYPSNIENHRDIWVPAILSHTWRCALGCMRFNGCHGYPHWVRLLLLGKRWPLPIPNGTQGVQLLGDSREFVQ